MQTVLIGWELGAGRGHIMRLVPIIAAYRRKGWQVIAALRSAPRRGQFIKAHLSRTPAESLDIIPAPIFSHTQVERGSVSSLADILSKTGFSKPELVRPLVTGWQSIIDRYRPDVVISDSAPSLNIAVRGRVPLIIIGNGWTVPPDLDPVPPLLPGAEADAAIRNASEAVLSAMNDAIPGSAPVERFADLLRGDINFVCSLDETDPYRGRRIERLYWPFEISAPKENLNPKRKGGLIYLPRDHPARPGVEQAMSNVPLHFDAFFSDNAQSLSANVRVRSTPIDFADAIPRARLVIHHGGLGTTIQCIVNHVPQLFFPADLEKMLIAKEVVHGRFGYVLAPNATPATVTATAKATVTMQVPNFDASRMATLSPEASIKTLLSAPI